MFVEEIGVSQDKGSHRKSRPPLGVAAKKLIWVGGQKLWLAKKLRPSEFVGRKKSSLAGDIACCTAELPRDINHQPPPGSALEKSTALSVLLHVRMLSHVFAHLLCALRMFCLFSGHWFSEK